MDVFFSVFAELAWGFRWPIFLVFLLAIGRELRGLTREAKLHAILMFLYFFLIITCFWILKPLKKGLFIQFYKVHDTSLLGWELGPAQWELLAKESNLVLAIIAAFIFSRLLNRYKREKLAKIIIAFFAFALAGLSMVVDESGPIVIWLNYLLGDLYVTVMVAAFFAYLNDSEEPFSAKRIYGLIGLGGVLGGCVGASSITKIFGSTLPMSEALQLCSFFTTLLFFIATYCGQVIRRNPVTPRTQEHGEDRNDSRANIGLIGNIRDVTTSPYLFRIACIVGIYEIVSTLMDYQFTSSVSHHVPPGELKTYFSEVFLFTNCVAAFVQLFLARLILTRFGIGIALLILPVSALIGSISYFAIPVLFVGSLLNTMDNGFSYSINQSAKEILYVPLERDQKYRAKSVIDILVVRCAKGISVIVSLGLSFLFASYESVRWLSLVNVVFLAIWLIIILRLKEDYKNRER